MLVFDKVFGLFIAFAFGLAGVPLSFWLFRKDDKLGVFAKTVLGYAFGLVAVPLLFFIESLAGVFYSAPLIFVNWLDVFSIGAVLLSKEKMLRLPSKEYFKPSASWLPTCCIFAIMLAILLIGLSSAGAIIFELDPYFYLEGVRQVVYEGRNYLHDATAWYPTELSSHMGQPIWKYALASWFSAYNGEAPYSPYVLASIGGLYAPILGALTAFFAYLLFKEAFNARSGILAAGFIAFMPTMLIKFQGGNSQIEPFNVFALFFFFFAIVYAFKWHSKDESLVLLGLSYCAIVLGSNLSSLIIFSFSLFLFLVGFAQFLAPAKNWEEKRNFVLKFLAIIAMVQVFVALYGQQGSDFVTMFKVFAANFFLPLCAFAFPAFLFEMSKKSGILAGKSPQIMALKFALVAFLAGAFVLFGQHLPVIGDLVKTYLIFGAYTEPLLRTIAEQAPGSEFYSGQFGFAAANLSGLQNPSNDFGISLFSAVFSLTGAVNSIPTFIMNMAYSLFVTLMNSLTGSNFEFISKGNSLMTFFLFSGAALLAIRIVLSALHDEEFPIYALLLLPFIVSVSLVGFGKQKLVMYLGVALVMAAGAFWGEAEKLISSYLINHKKMASRNAEKQPASASGSEQLPFGLAWGAIAWAAVVLLVLMQFGSPAILAFQLPNTAPGPLFSALSADYGLRAQPLLMYALQPRVQDNPEATLPKLREYCKIVPQNYGICNSVANWSVTAETPDAFYSPELCMRSMWTDTVRSAPDDLRYVFSYRCSFVSDYWIDAMEWIRKNVNDSDYVISWWDYGHWTNFFGEKKTVLRNEHASSEMIGRTAYSFVHGTPKELRDTMRAYGSRTVLMDIEIIGSGSSKNDVQLGGKFSALNYLGCAWANKTTVANWPGQSQCELDNLWEQVIVPLDGQQQRRCVISESNNLVGIEAYVVKQIAGQPPARSAEYCLSNGQVNGKQGILAYRLGERDENGDLKQQRGYFAVASNNGQYAVLTAFYDKRPVWPSSNGVLSDGWADRTTKYYGSPLYSAFFMDELEGFDLVYSSPQIRMYRMKDEYWDSAK